MSFLYAKIKANKVVFFIDLLYEEEDDDDDGHYFEYDDRLLCRCQKSLKNPWISAGLIPVANELPTSLYFLLSFRCGSHCLMFGGRSVALFSID